MHLECHPATPLSIGTTYTGAYAGDINGPSPEFNNKIDNTVPGFPLSTFDEAYVAYKTAFIDASVGDKFYNFIWMPISDARVKPSAYQGGDISFRPIPGIQVGVSRIIRFESRTSSNFQPDTLLTAFIPGQPTPLVVRNTAGALHTYLFGTTKRFTGRFENYQLRHGEPLLRRRKILARSQVQDRSVSCGSGSQRAAGRPGDLRHDQQ